MLGSYSFHYITNGKLIKSDEKALVDDLDALAIAEQLAAISEIVVWQGYRYVARVKKNNERPSLKEPSG